MGTEYGGRERGARSHDRKGLCGQFIDSRASTEIVVQCIQKQECYSWDFGDYPA